MSIWMHFSISWYIYPNYRAKIALSKKYKTKCRIIILFKISYILLLLINSSKYTFDLLFPPPKKKLFKRHIIWKTLQIVHCLRATPALRETFYILNYKFNRVLIPIKRHLCNQKHISRHEINYICRNILYIIKYRPKLKTYFMLVMKFARRRIICIM
jgi:hypothetical protein